MIRVSVSRADATVTETETLTAGRVGLECAFTFTSEWDGLVKVAKFEGAETIEVVLGNRATAIVPAPCMATAGYNLRVGVYGLGANSVEVIPTVWAKAGKIKDSASPEDDILEPIDYSLAAQVIEKSDTALTLAQEVAQAAANGDFNGTDGVSPTASVSKTDNVTTLTVTDANGTTTADIIDGTDGTDGVSPEVAISNITDGHRVTITDAAHPGGQSFDVMDGQDGQDGAPGADGQGVPSGGTTGQVLTKASGTDYDTEWATPAIPSASDIGAIALPDSPNNGDFLCWDGSKWAATTVPAANGEDF